MGRKILIVDDEPHCVLSTRYVLEAEGYEIIEANDGDEAFEQAQNEMPDLMLLDIMMPPSGKHEGFKVCKKIKKNEKTSHIIVIMASVLGANADKDMAKEAGASDYITKPYNIDDVAKMIKKYLD